MKITDYYKIKNCKAVRNLSNAIVSLVEESDDPSSITVTEITKRAGVSRSTFYNHFIDVNSLINYIYFSSISTAVIGNNGKNLRDNSAYKLLSIIKENPNYYRKIANMSGQNSFPNFIRDVWYTFHKEFFIKRYGKEKYDEDIDMSVKISAAGISLLITEWIQEDFPITVEDYSRLIITHLPERIKDIIIEQALNNI